MNMPTTPRIIILAAGQGSRLKHYTVNQPKCMLSFGHKTLLQHQISAFAVHGLHDIHVVRGHQGHIIAYPDIIYHENAEFLTNNILSSLFCAEPAIEGPLIVSYSDILFGPRIVADLLKTEHDIALLIDVDWLQHYVGRAHHPIDEAEIVVMDNDHRISCLGKIIRHVRQADGEFIGMMKLTAHGTELLKSSFRAARLEYFGKPFQRATIFSSAYITDLLQHMINRGIAVHGVPIRRGWQEIDTVEDYENALRTFDSGSL